MVNLRNKISVCFYHCCCSVAQSYLTLCNPMDCSTAGFPILHYLPEFAQTHVHWVYDAIQPSFTIELFNIRVNFCLCFIVLFKILRNVQKFKLIWFEESSLNHWPIGGGPPSCFSYNSSPLDRRFTFLDWSLLGRPVSPYTELHKLFRFFSMRASKDPETLN